MNKIIFTCLIIFLQLFILSCDSKETKDQNFVNDKYLKIYSGGYTIEVAGISSYDEAEAYALNSNGKAKWMQIANDGLGGARIVAEKNGYWIADENKIVITIQGNSGEIVEEYKLSNGRFTNSLIKERYLKKTK